MTRRTHLLNPLQEVTPKRKEKPIIAYGTEPLQSPMQEIYTLSNDRDFTGSLENN